MNDTVLTRLKATVERSVRPVRASRRRKRRMREELLAHVTCVFEEELGRLGDEQAALNETRRRFGDPEELAGPLQDSLPWWDGYARFMDRQVCFEPRPGESAMGRAARNAALFALLQAVVLVPAFLLVPLFKEIPAGLRELTLVYIAQLAGGSLFLLILSLLVHGIRRTLLQPTPRRPVVSACLTGLAAALFVPVLGFGLIWALTGGLAGGAAAFRSLLPFAPVMVAVTFVVAWHVEAEFRDDQEWAGLDIAE